MKAAKVVALLFSATLVVALLALFVFGRGHHKALIRIDVSTDSSGLQFSFSRCGRRGGEAYLNLLEVVELRPGGMVREECELIKREDETLLPSVWRYGTPVPEFELIGCDRLQPGKHRIIVMGPGQVGTRVIEVASDGSVTSIEPPCR